MTGRGMGFCMIQLSSDTHEIRQGYIGAAGVPLSGMPPRTGKENAMPGEDGTGPWGMGPMTGRAAGYCAGYPAPGFANPMLGGFSWGRGSRGRGGGRGRRNWYYATGLTGWQRAAAWGPWGWSATPEQQLDALKAQAEHLENTLAGVRARVEELEAAKTEA